MFIERIISTIYRQNVAAVIIIIAVAIILRYRVARRVKPAFDAVLLALSVAAVLFATVFVRLIDGAGGSERGFAFFARYTNEFVRELVMNALLFFPIGISLPFVVKSFVKSVIICVALSTLIEALQWAFAVGMTQVSDLIFNTLGAAAGGISYLLAEHKKRGEGGK